MLLPNSEVPGSTRALPWHFSVVENCSTAHTDWVLFFVNAPSCFVFGRGDYPLLIVGQMRPCTISCMRAKLTSLNGVVLNDSNVKPKKERK